MKVELIDTDKNQIVFSGDSVRQKNEDNLITNRSERDKLIDQIEVLDKVKSLIMLPSQTVTTTEQVANYFEISVNTLKSLIKDNSKEFKKNGYIVLTNKKLKSFKGQLGNPPSLKYVSALGLLTKRTVLNIAMLLKDSKIAKQIRKELLDFTESKKEDLVIQISKKEMLQLKILNGITEEERMLALKEFTDYNTKCSKQEVIEQVKDELDIAKRLTTGEGSYDIGLFVKALAIKGLGKNNFFRLLKDKGILMKNNCPKQNYMQYFEIEIERKDPNTNLVTYNKINIKPNGVKYIFKKLKEWNYATTQTVEDILKQLNERKK